jgi:hypothetical protein
MVPGLSQDVNSMKPSRRLTQFFWKHSLSLAALGVVVTLIVLYSRWDPATHVGSFFGNAIADWTGVLVTIVTTKHLYERGSKESKQPRGRLPSAAMEFLRTGVAWVLAFRAMNPGSRWGQVVGNIVSEWTQILGLVLMTKRLMEVGSKT